MGHTKLVIEDLARKKGVTIKAVCEHLELSQNAYYHMLRVNNLRSSTIEKLCDYFGVKPCVFFHGNCDKVINHNQNYDLIDGLSMEEKGMILDIILKHNRAGSNDRVIERLEMTDSESSDARKKDSVDRKLGRPK